jgi:hypothetical protein
VAVRAVPLSGKLAGLASALLESLALSGAWKMNSIAGGSALSDPGFVSLLLSHDLVQRTARAKLLFLNAIRIAADRRRGSDWRRACELVCASPALCYTLGTLIHDWNQIVLHIVTHEAKFSRFID